MYVIERKVLLLESLRLFCLPCIVFAVICVTRKGMFSDCQNEVRIIQIGSPATELQSRFFSFACRIVFVWRAKWIPKDQNTKADYLSRIVDPDDRKLNPKYFDMIFLRWGPFDIDRMADNRNTQLTRLNSKFWCPESEAVDCFTQDWRFTNNWICPSPYLVLSVLRHMQACNAYGTSVFPEWKSANY